MTSRVLVALAVASTALTVAGCSPELVLGALAGDAGAAAPDSTTAPDAGVVCTPTRGGDASTCTVPLASCDPLAQDCARGEKCIVADQTGGYDWGAGRPAQCVPASAGVRDALCTQPSDCGPGLQCVFSTMHDTTTYWFSMEASYLPDYASRCLPVCALADRSTCPLATDACHPVQLWGFSGRDVNETYGVCHAPP